MRRFLVRFLVGVLAVWTLLVLASPHLIGLLIPQDGVRYQTARLTMAGRVEITALTVQGAHIEALTVGPAFNGGFGMRLRADGLDAPDLNLDHIDAMIRPAGGFHWRDGDLRATVRGLKVNGETQMSAAEAKISLGYQSTPQAETRLRDLGLVVQDLAFTDGNTEIAFPTGRFKAQTIVLDQNTIQHAEAVAFDVPELGYVLRGSWGIKTLTLAPVHLNGTAQVDTRDAVQMSVVDATLRHGVHPLSAVGRFEHSTQTALGTCDAPPCVTTDLVFDAEIMADGQRLVTGGTCLNGLCMERMFWRSDDTDALEAAIKAAAIAPEVVLASVMAILRAGVPGQGPARKGHLVDLKFTP